MTRSRSIHIAENGSVFSFLWLSNIPLKTLDPWKKSYDLLRQRIKKHISHTHTHTHTHTLNRVSEIKSAYWKLAHPPYCLTPILSNSITLPTEVRLVKVMVFPVVMYGCERWTIKKAEH